MLRVKRTAAAIAVAASAALAFSGATANAAVPHGGSGSNGHVTLQIIDAGAHVHFIGDLPWPNDIFFPVGHWQITIPGQGPTNVWPDGTLSISDYPYQEINFFTDNRHGQYCATWWAANGSGGWDNAGSPCVGN